MLFDSQKKDFSPIFDKHYARLYSYAFKLLKNNDSAEEVVQETFIKLWKNFKNINKSERSISSYLVVTLKHTIIDFFRKNKAREKHTNLYSLNISIEDEIDSQWEISQLIEQIYATLQTTTVEIFRLSRDKGFTYKEIAAKKNISIKTVESHISKALSVFREGLQDYL